MKTVAALTFLTAVSATPLLKRASGTPTGIDDTVILNYALTLEHLENAFYADALKKFDDKAFTDAGLPASARGLFAQIAAHEQAHVDFLSGALGENATQACTYEFGYTNPKEFAAVSQILEGVGVSAYAGAAQYITNPAYLTAAAVVLSTEARHASWVAAAVNDVQPWSGALDVPLSLNQVYSLAAAFITGCPESNPTLPVKAFPAVTFSPATAKPGDNVTLTFDGVADGLTAVFLTGLANATAEIKNGQVTIPKELDGTVYLVITQGGATLSDDTTVAGPAVFQFQAAIPHSSNDSSESNSTTTQAASSMDGAMGLSTSMAAVVLLPLTAGLMAMFA